MAGMILRRIASASERPATYYNDAKNLGYREAIRTLNLLQKRPTQQMKSNNSLLEKNFKIMETYKFLARSGVTVEDLDSLPVIHVAGTKGKGSTCAFCESILQHYGMEKKKQSLNLNGALANGCRSIYTGLYTSPHLIEVRERIRLAGEPISPELFSSYFWNVYSMLMQKREHEEDLPSYFMFLTVLAFNIFIKEGVDVAVIEVGIGGESDCTNVIRKPIAVGITSLGFDHQHMLGGTLDKIAWQKAGILKKGSPAFTVLGQAPEALSVLEERAREKEVILKISPPFSSYPLETPLELPGNSNIQELNASLALQLANTWIKWHYKLTQDDSPDCDIKTCVASPFKVDFSMAAGLRECKWPGRTQIFHWNNCFGSDQSGAAEKPSNDFKVTLFLDGAHTGESIQLCLTWFEKESLRISSNDCMASTGEENDGTIRILIFNSIGERNIESLLAPLAKSNLFHAALFTCNDPTSQNTNLDVVDHKHTHDGQISRCQNHLSVWHNLSEQSQGYTYEYVSDALASINKIVPLLTESEPRNVHVLVSGSLHLVGSVLSIVDPNLFQTPGQNKA